MPPKGGYPKIDFVRRLGNRGPSGAMIWAGIFGMTFWGFYQIGVTNEEKRFNRKEQRESRMAILPYLMTEQDITEMQKMKKTTIIRGGSDERSGGFYPWG